MEPVGITRVKVCCISSVEEAALAVRRGASALGLVSAMPSGPGVIGDVLIAEIAATVPPGVATFLLTSGRDADTIVRQARTSRVDTLQLVDRVPDGLHDELREALPGVRLVQVVHVVDEDSIDEAAAVAPRVDAVLLDSGNPALQVKELGGTGRVHDWSLSRRIRERLDALDTPLFLAGGLTPENVADATAAVRPFGVDLCSGVRSEGRLDDTRLASFMNSLNETNQQLTRIT